VATELVTETWDPFIRQTPQNCGIH